MSGQQKYIIIALGDYPSSSNVAWAQGIIKANPDSRIIIDTHTYLGSNSRLSEGTSLWNSLIKQNKNIFLVVCGHINDHGLSDATLNIPNVGVNGNPVNQYRADYQNVNYGNGFIVIMKIQPSVPNIQVSVFSPYTGKSDENAKKTLILQLTSSILNNTHEPLKIEEMRRVDRRIAPIRPAHPISAELASSG